MSTIIILDSSEDERPQNVNSRKRRSTVDDEESQSDYIPSSESEREEVPHSSNERDAKSFKNSRNRNDLKRRKVADMVDLSEVEQDKGLTKEYSHPYFNDETVNYGDMLTTNESGGSMEKSHKGVIDNETDDLQLNTVESDKALNKNDSDSDEDYLAKFQSMESSPSIPVSTNIIGYESYISRTLDKEIAAITSPVSLKTGNNLSHINSKPKLTSLLDNNGDYSSSTDSDSYSDSSYCGNKNNVSKNVSKESHKSESVHSYDEPSDDMSSEVLSIASLDDILNVSSTENIIPSQSKVIQQFTLNLFVFLPGTFVAHERPKSFFLKINRKTHIKIKIIELLKQNDIKDLEQYSFYNEKYPIQPDDTIDSLKGNDIICVLTEEYHNAKHKMQIEQINEIAKLAEFEEKSRLSDRNNSITSVVDDPIADSDMILLHLRSNTDSLKVKVSTLSTIRDLINLFVDKKLNGKSPNKINLKFDGTVLESTETIEDLDMEDEDTIDVIIK